MSNQQRMKIPKLQDSTLIECFKKIAKLYHTDTLHVSVLGGVQLGAVTTNEEPSLELTELLSHDAAIIDTISLNINGFGIAFHRGGNCQPQDKSPYYDEITLNTQQGSLESKDKINIVSIISKDLKSFDPNRVANSVISKEENQLIAIHQSTLDRLEKLNEDLVKKGIEYREILDREVESKYKKIEEELDKSKKELEEDYECKKLEIEERELTVKEKLKEIDNRDNTHARRQLRKSLIDEVKERFNKFRLSDNTNNLRWPIHTVCILFFIIFCGGAYWYANELFAYVGKSEASTIGIIIISLKQLGFTSAGIATIVFYIRWLNRWFEQHAKAEFELRQFQLDIDRASWVVETALEWKTTLGSPIPTVLLESITNNLFVNDEARKNDSATPVTDFTSAILGTSSKMKIKSGNTELELDGKRINKSIAKESKTSG